MIKNRNELPTLMKLLVDLSTIPWDWRLLSTVAPVVVIRSYLLSIDKMQTDAANQVWENQGHLEYILPVAAVSIGFFLLCQILQTLGQTKTIGDPEKKLMLAKGIVLIAFLSVAAEYLIAYSETSFILLSLLASAVLGNAVAAAGIFPQGDTVVSEQQ